MVSELSPYSANPEEFKFLKESTLKFIFGFPSFFLVSDFCSFLFLQQPNARPSGRDYSYIRMDAPHINGALPQNRRPTHLTNGYSENMMANVCSVLCIKHCYH